jgi:hypothetical protein
MSGRSKKSNGTNIKNNSSRSFKRPIILSIIILSITNNKHFPSMTTYANKVDLIKLSVNIAKITRYLYNS